MLDRIKTYLNEGNAYYALEICERSGETLVYLLQIQRKGQELFIVGETVFTSLGAAVAEMEKNRPVCLVVNTARVLVKINDTVENAGVEAQVHSAFPNLDFDSFYYSITKGVLKDVVAICRKEEIDGYLGQLSKLKISVIQLFLGVSPVSGIREYLPSGSVPVSNQKLVFSEGSLENVIAFGENDSIVPQVYDVNGLSVKSTYLLGLSGILAHLLKNNETEGNITAIATDLRSAFVDQRHFGLLLKSSLIGILTLLFVNFLFFNHYYEKVGTLQEKIAVNDANKEQLVQLKTAVKIKEERLNAVLAMANSNTSALLDTLAQSLPSTLLLREIQYQPLQKPLREAKPIEIENKTVLVSGEVYSSSDFYTWVAELEKLSWVAKVETTDYDYSRKNTSDFTIKITIDER
ncbi:hypothetical protein [Maribacter sp. 2-571]|uniref:hypothetical protein n=1 Tax=Maribacter sp. 2-571 TaxID=3417569 RepID=UPI003D328248